ncbi:MAG TPA: 16S rRNA (cytosine(1402)-N(4))-methyltransferase RsmH [Acidimicrobiales bacterium]|nr:16S rRNA (cytosine(1402)-N(4))-methyltransferase RsmH [Acidimicrobiales bacterium]
MRCPPTGEVEGPHSARFHRSRSGKFPDGARPVGGQRMSQVFSHEPVMVDEVLALFAPTPRGVVVDATLGGGGHARALLSAHPHLSILGIDRDPAALAAAAEALAGFEERVSLHRARFDALARLVEPGTVSGVLFDLGVSSPQLDRGERGFSYRSDAPLDMRMDPDQTRTAADVVNTIDERELVDILRDNGEGRLAGRIARAIVRARPLLTTEQLVDVVRAAIPAPARRAGGHPAKRVFQALRIEVNDELRILPAAVDAAVDALAPGGRIVVLSYHSGEDRIVKARFADAATGGCTCPPALPCVCGAVPTVRLLNRGARKPTAAEVRGNPRAESARLRAAERLPDPPLDAEVPR